MARVVGKSAQYWSSFSPSNLPGIALWYDFSDRSTFDLSGEFQITRIRDKSGNGCGATPSNPADSYWIYDAVNNGMMRVPPGASNNFVTDICLNASTLYFSGATVLSGVGGQLVYIFGGKEPGCAYFRTGTGAYGFGQTNNVVSTPTAIADSNAMSVGSFTGGGFLRVATNGIVAGTMATYANPPQVRSGIPLILGTYNLSTIRNYGSMYELILFSNVLTDSERAALEDYLIDKWMTRPDPPATITAPTDISGCNLWLDVSGGASNFTFVPGTSNISKWIDKSLCNYDVSATNTTTCPIWQDVSQYVYFNGTIASLLNTARPEPSWGEETGFIVGIRGATSGYRGIINAKASGSQVGPWRQIGTVSSYANRLNNVSPAVAQFNPIESIGDGNTAYVPHELCWRIKGKEYFSRMGGQASCYKTVPNWRDISSGGTTIIGTADQYLREIILYNRALSFNEISNVTAYLTQKWGLSNYKTFSIPPTSNRAYGSSSPFMRPFQVPYDIANCTLWLDAKDRNTIELDASGNVLRWLDKSGWGNDVSASASRPFYSNETLVFNSNVMTVRNSNQSATGFRFDPPFHMRFHTIVALHKPTSAAGNTSVVDFSTAGTSQSNVSFPTIDLSGTARGYITSGTAGANRVSSTFLENSLTTEYNIITASIQSNGFTIYRNGIIQRDASGFVGNNISFTGSTAITSIGRWGNPSALGWPPTFYQGEIREIFMFDRAISTYSVAQIEAYLAKKWNLTSILPSNHLVFSNQLPSTVSIAPPALEEVALWVDAFSYVGQYSNTATITTNWSNGAYKPSAVVPTGTPKFLANAWQGRPGIDMTSGSFATTFSNDVSLSALAHQTFIVASYNTGAPNTIRDALFFRATATTNPKHSVLQVRALDVCLGTTFTTAAGAATGGLYTAPTVTAGAPFLFESAAAPTTSWWAVNGATFCNTSTPALTSTGYGWAGIGQDSGTNTTPTWNGVIHEIITYGTNSTNPADFNNQSRFRIRAYLARKWGILNLLPTYPEKGIAV